MNPFLQVLLTLALVTGGLATYHVLVDRGSDPASAEVAAVGDRDLAALEARIDALENRAPLLRGSTDGGERLLDLEGRVKSLEAQPARRQAGRTEALEAPAAEELPDSGAAAPDDETALSDAQKKAVRRLVEGAVREQMGGRASDRVNRTLEQLDLELTAEQREKLDAAWATHRESVGEVWRAGREAGTPPDEIRAEMTTLNQKFTQGLAEFLPAGDAEAITGALTSMRRGPGGGGGGGRRPGGGR